MQQIQAILVIASPISKHTHGEWTSNPKHVAEDVLLSGLIY